MINFLSENSFISQYQHHFKSSSLSVINFDEYMWDLTDQTGTISKITEVLG